MQNKPEEGAPQDGNEDDVPDGLFRIKSSGFFEQGNELYYYINETTPGAAGWLELDGAKYYLYDGGRVARGMTAVAGVYYFFDQGNGQMKHGIQRIGEKLYSFSPENGQLGGGWTSYADGNKTYANGMGVIETGLRDIAGKWYYLHPDTGLIMQGIQTVNGKKYLFDKDGVMLAGEWVRVGTKTYHTNFAGVLQTGLMPVGAWWYYFDPNTAEMQYGIRKVNGKLYSFSQYDGHLVGGWNRYGDGNVSFAAFNGEIQTGWQTIEKKEYYFNPVTGLMVRGVQIINNKIYIFDNDGVKRSGDWVRIGNKTYHTDASGVVQTGLLPVGQWWYYFSPDNGEMQYGIRKVNGKLYSFSQYDGHLVGGWNKYGDGNVSFAAFNGEIQTGWQTIEKKEYYFNPVTGLMVRGVQIINNKIYIFDNDGVKRSGDWVRIGNKTYHTDASGVAQTGLMPVGDWWYYFSPDNGEMQYGIRKINGKLYSFSQYDGHLVGGWSRYADGNVSYAAFNGEIQTGFQQIGSWTYYFSPTTGLMAKGFQTINHKRYYFAEGGGLMSGWITVGNDRYYADAAGVLLTGTQSIGGVTYIFDADGRLVATSQKQAIDVSAYQGYIDWQAVKASGVDYAILRAITWSGSATTGSYVEDAFFERNMKQAKAAGIKVGAYIYTYAFNQNEVISEVNAFLAVANRLKNEGYTFDLPVFVDHEYHPILTAVPNIDDRTFLLRMEMRLLRENGYYPGMYMSTSWAKNNIRTADLQREGYDLWIADYRGYNGYGDSVVMWQYSSEGKVSGIAGNVDVNYLYKDYSGLINGSTNGEAQLNDKWTVYDQATKTNKTDTVANILAAIVSNEVSGTALTGSDRIKMYKAQAVAAHSWLLYHYENYNSLPSVKLKYDGYYSQIQSAIAPVLNMILTYNGKAANTVYTSCNSGKTNSSLNYWGSDLPYLRTVDSSYEWVYAGSYKDKKMDRTRTELLADFKVLFGTSNFRTSLPESEWIKITSRDAVSGYVTGIKVCGQTVKISDFYEKVGGAYSPNFTVSYHNGIWTFISQGNGHGVGMSQFGAMGLIARAGYDWTGVLGLYYPGAQLTTIK